MTIEEQLQDLVHRAAAPLTDLISQLRAVCDKAEPMRPAAAFGWEHDVRHCERSSVGVCMCRSRRLVRFAEAALAEPSRLCVPVQGVLAVLDAAGSGMCGDRAPTVVPAPSAFCALPAGHDGLPPLQWGVAFPAVDPDSYHAGYQAAVADQLAGTIWGELQAERERAHAKHGDTGMEAAPVDAMFRASILGEEIGEASEALLVAFAALALTAAAGKVQKALNDGRHDGQVDLSLLRGELVQVATMAAAWADRIPKP